MVLSFILGLGILAYAPAFGGAFLLDDLPNLGGLARIDDLHSALVFIFSGDAGPLGRPIALASFALQAGAWGESAKPFIVVNVLIHLLNGILLTWVLYRVSVLSRIPQGRRVLVVLAAAALWMLMPLLASASLMIIQRMTTLSATFVLLGLGGYLHAREMIEVSPRRSMILMSACLVIATALAVLTKESGALLPVYVLVLEATVLPRPAITRIGWKVWKYVFLVLPAVAIASYVALRIPYDGSTVLRRDFTGWERLITQARILWEYLLNAFLPSPGSFGPFHDGYPVARSILDPLTIAAVVGWVAVLVLAILKRRTHPFFALAVLWFLGGHIIESTVVPLELYFEHRNYLPVVGPVFALCSVLAYVPLVRRRLVLAGAAAYILAHAAVLFGQAWTWGDPPRAARQWHEQFPDSVRAATNLAQYRLQSEGPQGAIHSLYRIVDSDPTAGYLLIPALNLSCIGAPEANHDDELLRLMNVLPNVDFSFTVSTMLSDLYTTASRVDCGNVNGASIMRLADAVIQNPRYSGNDSYQRLHHQLLARVLRDEGKFEQALSHLRRALELGEGADLNMMIVTTYADAGELNAAREHIAKARSNAPLDPFKRFVWQSGLDELQVYIEALANNKPSIPGVSTP